MFGEGQKSKLQLPCKKNKFSSETIENPITTPEKSSQKTN